jgi:carboxylate-amine ligase
MTEVGVTIGIEEEYHLVDPETAALMPLPALAACISHGRADPHLRTEMLTSQLESVTEVCTSLGQLRSSLWTARRAAAAAAAPYGAAVLATSSHPFATRREIKIASHRRYERLLDRFGALPREFNLCGCHVHVSVPDLDTATAILSRARAYLPLFVALTGSSPFYDGADTAYTSYRTAMLALWPQGGTPPRMDAGQDYLGLVDDLQEVGLIDDASAVLWELRPSTRYPTLEWRIADVCPDADDAVLLAALIRSLTRTLAGRADAAPPTGPPDALLLAARWRAARYGLDGDLWSFERHALVPAEHAVRELIAELRDDLEQHDEYDEVTALVEQLLARGPSAVRQRAVCEQAGNLRDVARDGIAITNGAGVTR